MEKGTTRKILLSKVIIIISLMCLCGAVIAEWLTQSVSKLGLIMFIIATTCNIIGQIYTIKKLNSQK